MIGVVKWFDGEKGYGFITPEPESQGRDELKDIFVHYSGIDGDGFKSLKHGERVEYEIEATARGLQAIRVKVSG